MTTKDKARQSHAGGCPQEPLLLFGLTVSGVCFNVTQCFVFSVWGGVAFPEQGCGRLLGRVVHPKGLAGNTPCTGNPRISLDQNKISAGNLRLILGNTQVDLGKTKLSTVSLFLSLGNTKLNAWNPTFGFGNASFGLANAKLNIRDLTLGRGSAQFSTGSLCLGNTNFTLGNKAKPSPTQAPQISDKRGST